MASMMGFQRIAPFIDRSRSGRGESLLNGEGVERLATFQARVDVEYARSLTKLIESEIIPRLLVAHSADSPTTPIVDGSHEISAAEVEAFAPLALQIEADELLDHTEMFLRRGVTIETLLVDLLAPSARLLGEFWEDDRCDFVDVTMGLWRLQEIVHELSARGPSDHPVIAGGRRALFASMPGDQHSFGAVVIEEMFCREGWLTDRLHEASKSDLLGKVGTEWFDLVGLTISCDCHIATLPSIISAVRNISKNPRICVMVGGRIFVEDASLATGVGADGTAPDARLAVEVAGQLVSAIEREAVY